ncbi:hypothetical protein [Terriglobus aquaticus]|uniref:hypothetical protein n=1 Tax=Terriglobus aquaticus TaxID=940139 RepID=UPI0021E02540|nr:hypothetical protein [Terriglobus aquaticus]
MFGTQLLYAAYFWMLRHRQVHLVETLYLVLGLIVAQIVLQSLLALTSNPEWRDERDRAIESRGYRVGYSVLLAGLMVTIASTAHHLGFLAALSAAAVINTLLFAIAVAELTKLATQMALYRRTA